ncbi:MAG: hypothetical protein ACO3RS_07590, partial [Candidatus Puniceispirillaceae bacterium]
TKANLAAAFFENAAVLGDVEGRRGRLCGRVHALLSFGCYSCLSAYRKFRYLQMRLIGLPHGTGFG